MNAANVERWDCGCPFEGPHNKDCLYGDTCECVKPEPTNMDDDPLRASSAAPVDYGGELMLLTDAFHRVVNWLRSDNPAESEAEMAEVADAALFRAEEVLDRGE